MSKFCAWGYPVKECLSAQSRFTPWSSFFSMVFTQMVLGAGGVFPGSWHNTQWAFQPRFIMVHKHTRPQCRKASASLYFCPHVKSVNEEPLLFGLMPSAGITFFVTLTNFSVQRSSQRRELEHRVIETIHYAEARRIAASSGGQEKDAFSYPELSKYDLCSVATSWYIHTSLREPFSDSHF